MATLSIRTRLILVMNLLVAGVGATVGWVGVAVTEQTVESRLVDGPARGAARLFQAMRLPLSDEMMDRLALLFDAHVAAGPADRPALAASSLPSYERHTLERYLRAGPLPRRLTIAGRTYVVATVEMPKGNEADGAPARLVLLVEADKVLAAQRAAAGTIVWITLGAVAVGTALGLWLAWTMVRPLRAMAARMDRVAEHARDPELPAVRPADRASAPRELARLAAAFDHLLLQLADARKQIARSARLATLGQLSAAVVHELRNPLSGLRMNAQVLADELARAGRDDDALRRIIRETDRMELYLAELLTLASSAPGDDAGPADTAGFPEVRLEAVAESALALLEGRCRHAGIAIRRDWGDGVPAVRADETRIRQVIVNLLLNALDATPSGGTMTLATRRRTDDGAVRFSVADTGPGVGVPDGADLFDPFVTTKSDGVGLGLYVCRRNIERHGGRIGYESSAAGATFWFDLPPAG